MCWLLEERDALKPFTEAAIKEKSYFPIALVIKNSSPSGIRNLYVELNFSATSDKLEVTDSPEERLFQKSTIVWSPTLFSLSGWETRPSQILKHVGRKLAKFDADTLQRTDRGWRLSFEWEALQPQRMRLVKPVLYVYSPESAMLSFNAKVFADSFPEPFALEAKVSIEAKQSPIDLINLLPDWRKLLDEVVSPKDAILEDKIFALRVIQKKIRA
jgi:hypothetical protein